MTPYTPVHYFLIGSSACVFASFLGGLVYLLIRERHKGRERKKQQRKNQLQKRRKAISGRPRHPGTSLSEDSTDEWQMSSQSPETPDMKSPETTDMKSSETSDTLVSKYS